jgi:hypothetical protein
MVSDEELDKFVEGDLQKDINQLDRIDPIIKAHMDEMEFLWDRVQLKLQDDNTCFSCQKQIKNSKDDSINKSFLLQASNSEKGVIAFVSLCNKCYDDEIKKFESKKIE